jgi:glycerol-3-phosphate dehydrogenase
VVLPPDEVVADGSDVAELLDTVNSCRVPDAQLGIDDIDDVTVGIRPLVSAPDADTYSASRRHELYDHGVDGVPGLWSVTGGKWTTGRAIAEDAVDRVFGPPASGGRFSGSPTRVRPIPGATGWAGDPAEVFALGATYRSDVAVDPEVREHLARLYGTRCTTVIDLVASDAELGRRIAERPGRLDIAAQVVVAVRDELALTLADIVDRRLVLGTLGQVEPAELQRVARVAAPLLGWPAEGRQAADTEHARRQRRRTAWRGTPAR